VYVRESLKAFSLPLPLALTRLCYAVTALKEQLAAQSLVWFLLATLVSGMGFVDSVEATGAGGVDRGSNYVLERSLLLEMLLAAFYVLGCCSPRRLFGLALVL